MKRVSLSVITSLLLPLGLAACGGSDDEGEEGPVEGDHSQYVVATIDPRSTSRLDIDGNGMSENKLGDLVNILGVAGFKVQETLDEAVLRGEAILLLDLQTTSFAASSTAGLSVYLGDSASASPAPCTGTTVDTCGKHLAGTGSFSIATSSPRDTTLKGKFAAGTLKAGPGNIAIQIALTGAPITVNLTSGRAQVSTVTADGIGKGIIGGAITQAELDNNVFPAIKAQLDFVIGRDCGLPADRAADPVKCSCDDPSTGLSILRANPGSFDHKAPSDCDVSIEEIKTHPLLIGVLKTDLVIDNQPALSVGLGFTAKKAVFAR